MRSLPRKMRAYLYSGMFLLASCFGTQLFAQSNAAVSGQVFDSTGKAVPGAAVALVRPSTQVKVTTTSDARGEYILPPVAPGNYELTVNAPGFAAWVDKGIVLEIGANRVVDATLTVGAATQTVTVTDAPPELKTQDIDQSTVTETSLVANIPLDVRNPFQETNFTPGVTQSNSLIAGTNMSSQDNTNTFYINGTKQGVSDILIDGAADTVYYDIHAAGAIPNLDSVEQFRIYTEAYDPEYGHTGGGIESFSIKSGTNQFHGEAWEYFRYSALDANGYNADAAGQAKPPFGRNQFGGEIGGPVDIPGLYHGRDKTFFYGSYEELLDSLPGITGALSAGFTSTVPTAAEKTGDFSQSTAWTLYDPTTTTHLGSAGDAAFISCPDGSQFSTSSTGYTSPGYYRCKMYGVPKTGGPAKYNVIPQSEINTSTAALLLSMYPAPNQTGPVPGSDENNYFSDATSEDKEYSYDIRIDHKFNDKQSIFGHIDFSDHYILYAPVFGPTSYTPTNGNDLLPLRNIIVDHTWVLRPNLIFDHHLSWGHMESHRGSVNPLGTAPFGIPASAAPGITCTFTPQVESTSNQIGTIGNSEPYERNPSSVWQYAASLSWLKGIHTFKFGADLRLYPDQLFDPQLLTVNTSRTFTGGPLASSPGGSTGNAVAELLMGQATVTSGYAPKVNTRHQYYAFYGEDTAKLTHQLTVTYGLRYSFEGGDVSSGNELNYLDTIDPSAIASQIPANPYITGSNLVGGVGIVGLNGSSRVLQIPGKLHFAPRLGFSYALDDKTVVHGGAGIFYQPTGSWETDPPAYGFTRQSTSIDAATNGYQPLFNLSSPFPGGLPAPYGNNPSALPGNNTGSGPLSIELGQTIEGNLRKQSDAYQESWSLDVQRMLPANFVVTAAYTGNEGVHLYGQLQLNQLSDAELALGSALGTTVPNPFYGIITDSSSPLSKSTVEEGLLLRAYPQFLNFESLSDGVGHSSYNAGQLTVEHRMSQGLSMLVGYTYSKSIDNIGEAGYSSPSVQDNGCMRCERSVADLDQTNVLRVSSMYELPFGPQKPFANSGALSYFAGGWQIGGTGQYNTGQPLQLSSPIEGGLKSNLYGMNVLRPELVPGQSITNTSGLPAIKGVYPSFNPDAFMQPGQTAHGVGSADPYMFGNTPRYLSDVRYPPYKDIDVFVQKNTKITERMSATIRFEALNALNFVVFGAPDTTVTDSNFGYNPDTQENNARECQLSARFTF